MRKRGIFKRATGLVLVFVMVMGLAVPVVASEPSRAVGNPSGFPTAPPHWEPEPDWVHPPINVQWTTPSNEPHDSNANPDNPIIPPPLADGPDFPPNDEDVERPPTTTQTQQPTNRTITAAGGTIGAGDVSSFAIQQDGTLWAWGSYGTGAIGRGVVNARLSPAMVLDNVTIFSAEGNRAIATRADGSFWTVQSTMPFMTGTQERFPINQENYSFVPLSNFVDVGSVAAIYNGSSQIFVIRPDGSLWGFGTNTYGALGDGTTEHRTTPVRIMNDVITVSNTAWTNTMAIRSDGSLWAWGNNLHGQLGDGTTTNRHSPIRIMDDVVHGNL